MNVTFKIIKNFLFKHNCNIYLNSGYVILIKIWINWSIKWYFLSSGFFLHFKNTIKWFYTYNDQEHGMFVYNLFIIFAWYQYFFRIDCIPMKVREHVTQNSKHNQFPSTINFIKYVISTTIHLIHCLISVTLRSEQKSNPRSTNRSLICLKEAGK